MRQSCVVANQIHWHRISSICIGLISFVCHISDQLYTYLKAVHRLVVCCPAGWAWTLRTPARWRFQETAFHQNPLVQQNWRLIELPKLYREWWYSEGNVKVFSPGSKRNLSQENKTYGCHWPSEIKRRAAAISWQLGHLSRNWYVDSLLNINKQGKKIMH